MLLKRFANISIPTSVLRHLTNIKIFFLALCSQTSSIYAFPSKRQVYTVGKIIISYSYRKQAREMILNCRMGRSSEI